MQRLASRRCCWCGRSRREAGRVCPQRYPPACKPRPVSACPPWRRVISCRLRGRSDQPDGSRCNDIGPTRLLKLFELWERRNDPVKRCSGGMKRRLEIARGLLHTPKILFLDEPTLGLDPQSRNQLWTNVKHLNQTEGVTVFLTTHYMDEADRVADRIAVIDHGKIVAQDSPAELTERTKSDSLEQAFLALTGSSIRDESAEAIDQMRQFAKMWRR